MRRLAPLLLFGGACAQDVIFGDTQLELRNVYCGGSCYLYMRAYGGNAADGQSVEGSPTNNHEDSTHWVFYKSASGNSAPSSGGGMVYGDYVYLKNMRKASSSTMVLGRLSHASLTQWVPNQAPTPPVQS